jgi:DNA ligase D-like protein (predicted 3'-phosphoesterase)
MKKPVFVVHEHHARNLHWDLRLEMEGVLRSFAIPKEPPTEPKVKRLAIRVEDHELSYADFEGTIPKGLYGAGKVKIWDRGTYELLERTGDKIIIRLDGRKLKGEYALIKFKRAGEKEWLFFRKG